MLYTLRFFSLQNAVCFIMLTCLVSCIIHILYTGCAEIKKNNSGAKGLRASSKLRKATISCVVSVRPLGTTLLPLDENLWRKFMSALKSDKNKEYFT